MRKAKLGDRDVAEIFSGQAAPQKAECFSSEGIPFIRAGSLEFLCSGGSEDALELISESVAEDYHMRLFPVDTIVFAKSGMSAKIPRVYRLKKECYIVSHLAAVIPRANIFPTYLEFYLSYNHPSSLISNEAYPSIRLSELENFEIVLPSLEQQKKIAENLNAIEKNLYNKKQQLSTLDVLVKARFVEMFGVKNENYTLLGKVVKSCDAGCSYNGNQRIRQAEEFAVLKVSSVTKGYFDMNEYKVIEKGQDIKKYVYPQKGDMLFSRANTRELVGATAIVYDDYPMLMLPDKLWKIRFRSCVNVFYIKFLLGSECYRRKLSLMATGTSGSMFNISMKKFFAIEIPLPPLALQEEFAAFVEQVEKTKRVIRQSLEKLETLKKSLMQEYFG